MMKQSTKIFNGKKLRAVYDVNKKVWLVSVIDVISAITNSTYDNSRNYWKQLKFRLRLRGHRLIRKTRQIKLVAKDGLHRYTDVMDYREIVMLIQALPYKAAASAKNWIGGVASKGTKIKNDLKECIKEVLLPADYRFIKHTIITEFKIM